MNKFALTTRAALPGYRSGAEFKPATEVLKRYAKSVEQEAHETLMEISLTKDESYWKAQKLVREFEKDKRPDDLPQRAKTNHDLCNDENRRKLTWTTGDKRMIRVGEMEDAHLVAAKEYVGKLPIGKGVQGLTALRWFKEFEAELEYRAVKRAGEQAQQEDPYASLRAAHAAGSKIQLLVPMGDGSSKWLDLVDPSFNLQPERYRAVG